MNSFSKNTSNERSGGSRPRRINKLIAFVVIVLAVVASIIFTLLVLSNSNRSAVTDTNTSSGSDQPLRGVDDPSPVPPTAMGTVITTGDSEFGTMLFNEKKQAIYIWELEESAEAECYGDCAQAWPPVLTDGTPRAAGEANGELLGTTKRTDGSTQVTYNGHPLYYYAHEGPDEVKCHNVSTHGGLWWVIQPNGNRAS